MFINKIKSFFSNLLAKLLGVKFVIVNVKDINIENNKTYNTVYPNRDAFIKLRVPVSKVLEIRHMMNNEDYIVLNVEGRVYTFKVVLTQHYYDLATGQLIELDIYANIKGAN